jgi:RNA 3'-terminal phosphate cyclase (ATP)
VGNLPLTIAERQKAAAVRILEGHGLGVHGRTLSVEAFGKGTFVFIKAEIADSVFAGFSSLGELGKRAEQVGEEAAASFQSYASSGASLDPHLADQIIPYLAYARGVSIFSTSQVTGHLFANLWIVEKFTGIEYAVQGEEGSPGLVSLTGKGLSFSA